MTDRDRALALAALEAGCYPWRSMADRFRVQGPMTTTLVAEVVAPTPIQALAAAANALGLKPAPQSSPLTLEMVEQIHDDIYWEIHDDYTLSDEARAIAWRAIRQMADRLRQQMGGADHE